MLNQTFLGRCRLADTVHGASIVRRLSLWLTRFSCILVMDRKKALISRTVFETKNEMRVHIRLEAPATFQSPRSYRAHALSSVAKSSLSQLNMWASIV